MTTTQPSYPKAGAHTIRCRKAGTHHEQHDEASTPPGDRVLAATILTVAACGAGGARHPAAGPSTRHAPASSSSTVAGGSSGPTPPAASTSAGQSGFTSALPAWNSAASAPAATRNTYLQQAADDLHASGNSSYNTPINELKYLANLPATNDTSMQQATAHSDVQALDSFFGTPGLLS